MTVVSMKIVFYCMTQPFYDRCQRCTHRCGTDDKSIEQLQLHIILPSVAGGFLARTCLFFFSLVILLISIFCSRDLQLYPILIAVIRL